MLLSIVKVGDNLKNVDQIFDGTLMIDSLLKAVVAAVATTVQNK